MIEPGLSFGKSHNLFFLFSGIITLLVWTSIISLDEFWKDKYYDNITSYYPFLSNLGGLFSLLLYDFFNKYFSFKTQILYFPFCLLFSFFVLFALGFTWEGQMKGEFSFKNLMFMLFIFLQGAFNTTLQTSLTRYTFNFSANEISLFNAGTAVSGIVFSLLYILVSLIDRKMDSEGSGDFMYVWWFCAVLASAILANFYVSRKYIKNFLDKKDDLTGETDSLREIVENEEKNNQSSQVFKKILAMFFCLILCYSITLACFPNLTLAVGNHWFKDKAMKQKSAIIALVFNIFDFLGKLSYKYLPMKDNIFVYIYSLLRILFVFFYVMAADDSLDASIFKNPYVGLALLILLAFTNGHFTSVAYTLASERCENKSKKTCGYLMTLSLFIGLVYGGLISATCFENKVIEV